MVFGDAHVFPGFLTPVLTQLFFPKPPTTFLTCFCRDDRRKYAGKKVHLNRESNSQPPGHESDTLNTDQPGRGQRPKERGLLKTVWEKEKMLKTSIFSFFHNAFYPSKANFNFSVAFNLSSANPFNFDLSKNLSFGKDLIFSLTNTVFYVSVVCSTCVTNFLPFS